VLVTGEALQAADRSASSEESQAAAAAEELRRALGAALHSGTETAGPAAEALAAAAESMRALLHATAPTQQPGWLADSELRRFVARAMQNPAFQAALGFWKPAEPRWGPPKVPVQPTPNQIADVWLLAGGWPNVRKWPVTVAQLLENQRRTVTEAVRALSNPK